MPDLYTDTKENKMSFSKKVWLTCGITALVVIILLLFKSLFSLVLLILASVLLAVYFHGFAGLLQKIKIPHGASVFISVVFNLLLIVAFFWFVGARLQQQISQLTDVLPQTMETARQKLSGTPIGDRIIQYFQSSGSSEKTKQVVKHFFSSSFGILSDLYIVLLMALFFTSSPGLYKKGLIELMPNQKAKDKCREVLASLYSVLKKWLIAQIIGIVFIAVLSGVGLLILGLPLVFTLALIAGILNFIPNFGPIIALIPAVLIGLMQGTTTALLVAGFYTLIQVIQSAVQQPLVQKKLVNIPPALTIVGQVALGAVGGFWGVLLASPIVAILMTVVDKLYLHKSPTSSN